MSQQRMAGSQQFKNGMQSAAKPKGQETDNYKTQGSHLIGADKVNQPADTSSLSQYINISKSATQSNGNFGVNVSNKYTNNARQQSNINKQENAGFSDNRITNNANFANSQQDRQARKNEGFSVNTINNFTNTAKNHREDNTAMANQFASQSVSKYLKANKANQSVNTKALDSNIRKAPLVDKAYSTVQSNNTYGDMYSYGRGGLPNYRAPNAPKPIEGPDFNSIYDKVTGDINKQKI